MKKIWVLLAMTLIMIHIQLPVMAEDASQKQPTTIFGKDDRKAIADPQKAPYNAVCRLQITYQNGVTVYGTGFIYGTNLLATAAHCLYDPEKGKAEQILVFPAASEELLPFGEYKIEAENAVFHYPQKWKDTGNWEYDYGAIETKKPWDVRIRPLKLEARSVTNLQKGSYSLVGYDYKSFTLYRSSGPLAKIRTYDLLYQIDTMHGESGAPIMDQKGTVVGIANYGAEQGGPAYNSAARITRGVYQFLMSCDRRS